jgi:hypothetical protein
MMVCQLALILLVGGPNWKRKIQKSGQTGRFGGVFGAQGAHRAASWCFAAVLNASIYSTTI